MAERCERRRGAGQEDFKGDLISFQVHGESEEGRRQRRGASQRLDAHVLLSQVQRGNNMSNFLNTDASGFNGEHQGNEQNMGGNGMNDANACAVEDGGHERLEDVQDTCDCDYDHRNVARVAGGSLASCGSSSIRKAASTTRRHP